MTKKNLLKQDVLSKKMSQNQNVKGFFFESNSCFNGVFLTECSARRLSNGRISS